MRSFPFRTKHYLGTPRGKRFFNKHLFAAIAPHYRVMNRVLSFGRDRHWKEHLIEQLPELADPLCVDLACGTGDITKRLAAKYPSSRVHGLDLVQEMLQRARKLCPALQASFSCQDMNDLALPPACADVVTGAYALRNAPDLNQAIAEICRIMKPGAVAAFLDFSRPPSGFRERVELALLKIWSSFWGILLHGNPDAYTYIADSLMQFPDRDALHALFNESGFKIQYSKRFFFGVIELIVVRRK